MLISFASLQGSPGVSTAVLALTWAWPRHAVAAECDPTGGRALAVFDPDGTHGQRGLLPLMLAARKMPLHRAMSDQLLTLPDGTGRHHLLPGGRPGREAAAVPWNRLSGLFQALDTVDVLADCGRLHQQGTPHAVLAASDLVVLVVHNDRHSLTAAIAGFDRVRQEAGLLGSADEGLVAVIAPRAPAMRHGFPLSEIATQFTAHGVPVIGTVAWDPVSAASFAELHAPGRRFKTSPLLISARRITGEVGRRATARARHLRQAADPVRGRVAVSQQVVQPVEPRPVPRPAPRGGDDAC
jgi:MinD-like ATPase involved in chromosome partitioning or flagellar assembly